MAAKTRSGAETTPGMLLDHDPHDIDRDLLEIWTGASDAERRQITDIAETLTRKTKGF